MQRNALSYTLLDNVAIQEVTSSTDVTPIAITFAAHWYVTWDRVTIVWHLTNTNANGTWTVTKTWANTFTLDGSTATWWWAGWNTWILCKAANILFVDDFRDVAFSVDYWSSSTATVKFRGSIWKSTTSDGSPDFAATQSRTNSWDNIELVDLQDWAYIDWDTWFSVSNSADNRNFEANINALRWITVVPVAPTDWSSTWTLTVKARLYNNS